VNDLYQRFWQKFNDAKKAAGGGVIGHSYKGSAIYRCGRSVIQFQFDEESDKDDLEVSGEWELVDPSPLPEVDFTAAYNLGRSEVDYYDLCEWQSYIDDCLLGDQRDLTRDASESIIRISCWIEHSKVTGTDFACIKLEKKKMRRR